ncbi:olfactory receptor 1J21-like [Gastrophryne carolinensis]
MSNCTNSDVQAFNLLGFATAPVGQIFLLMLVVLMYILTLLGNLFIVMLVCLEYRLHRPMYFFLCNLSSADIIFVSVTLPKFMSILITKDHTIAFNCCITQLYFLLLCGQVDIFTLTSMAYDRYVAICKPLQYSLIMRKGVYILMAAFSWLFSILNSLLHAMVASSLSFCSSHDIDHFFCDLKTLSMLSASDSANRDILTTVESIFIGCIPLLFIAVSYVYIILAVFRIKSSTGRLKVFSSCTSHLTTVLLFYGPIIFLYMKPENDNSREDDKLLSVLYVAVVPMLNPLVYSLRNKDVLGAAHKVKQNIKQMWVYMMGTSKK